MLDEDRPRTADRTGEDRSGSVGGVDGVRGGAWILVVTETAPGSPIEKISVWKSFRDLWAHAGDEGLLAVTVDIPIGLPGEGGRRCDREARQRLKPARKGGGNRASSVFPAPPLCTLGISDYSKALDLARKETGKGLSSQAHALLPKIHEVRKVFEKGACEADKGAFAEDARPRAAEVHPEVSFREMAGHTMGFHKSRQAGVAERLVHLKEHFPNIVEEAVLKGVEGSPQPGLDDVLDAVAAAWTARQLVDGTAESLGCGDEDETCYPMNIWV